MKNLVFKELEELKDEKIYKYLHKSEKKYKKYISNMPPVKPSSNQLFLYKPGYQHDKVQISDQYLWVSANYGMNQDEENPIKRQNYYIRIGQNQKYSTLFKRYVYYFIKKPPVDRVYLIYYQGDASVYSDLLHANRKVNLNRKYTTTDRKIMQNIRDTTKPPMNTYRKLLHEESKNLKDKGENFEKIYEKTHLPKDCQQVKNRLKYLRKKERISNDELYSVYQIGSNIQNYIHKFEILPEISIICGEYVYYLVEINELNFSKI